MLMYFLMWLLKPINIESAVIQKSNSVTMRSRLHFEIDEAMNDDDFVMISQDKPDTEQHQKFHNNRIFKDIAFASYNDIAAVTELINKRTRRSPRKREVSNGATDYDYEYLLNEYYEEGINDAKSNHSYSFSSKDTSDTGLLNLIGRVFGMPTRKCTEVDISIKAVKCLLKDYETQAKPAGECAVRLLRIVRIWLLVYLVIAVPLWCTRGLCCCCLVCKFFRPYRTIEEAKKFLVMNPPGLLKTTKGHEILYEPTKREKDSYEEFEHLIRTI